MFNDYFHTSDPGWEGQLSFDFDEIAHQETLMNDHTLTTVEELGKNIEALGKAFQDPNSNLNDLVTLANRCGLILRMQFIEKESKDDLET